MIAMRLCPFLCRALPGIALFAKSHDDERERDLEEEVRGGVEVGVVEVHNEGVHEKLQSICQIARPRRFGLGKKYAEPPC